MVHFRPVASEPDPALARFSPATRAWFASAFAAPTAAQTGAWDAIASDRHALVTAPTGSGKTLAAFLWAIDRLAGDPARDPGVRVLYVSPLKALAVDIEQNLRAPLAGIRAAAVRLGAPPPAITTALRTGDTPARSRPLLRCLPTQAQLRPARSYASASRLSMAARSERCGSSNGEQSPDGEPPASPRLD